MLIYQLDLQLILGTLVAFACAAVAVAFDLQDTVKAQMGSFANTSVLSCRVGWLAILVWGIFDAGM
jgi:hypothetical protein